MCHSFYGLKFYNLNIPAVIQKSGTLESSHITKRLCKNFTISDDVSIQFMKNHKNTYSAEMEHFFYLLEKKTTLDI